MTMHTELYKDKPFWDDLKLRHKEMGERAEKSRKSCNRDLLISMVALAFAVAVAWGLFE